MSAEKRTPRKVPPLPVGAHCLATVGRETSSLPDKNSLESSLNERSAEISCDISPKLREISPQPIIKNAK